MRPFFYVNYDSRVLLTSTGIYPNISWSNYSTCFTFLVPCMELALSVILMFYSYYTDDTITCTQTHTLKPNHPFWSCNHWVSFVSETVGHNAAKKMASNAQTCLRLVEQFFIFSKSIFLSLKFFFFPSKIFSLTSLN